MTKIAVLSDIHGNVQALEAVMNDIIQLDCEHVFCLGDIAMAGPQPNEVIDYIMNQQTWTVIQGNTDKMIAQYSPEIMDFLSEQYPVMANALEDDMKLISDVQKQYLDNLPPFLSLEVDNCSVLLVHGSPRANNEDILPNQNLEDIETIVADAQEKLIFCGHTHVPCGYQTQSGKTVVNVGSVGRPMTATPKACYCVVDFEDGAFEVLHRFIDYDNNTSAEIMAKRDFIGADRLADMLLNPIERHL